MTSIDTNIENYTIPEMLTILSLEDIDVEQITEQTNEYIEKFTKEKKPDLVIFFKEMQSVLLNYAEELETSEDAASSNSAKKQTDSWFQNQYVKQKNATQSDKITDRTQQIDVYDNIHVPMKQKQLGVANNFVVNVAQDTLNPNLKNSTQRFINLDSQFRQVAGINDSATDYTCDLSDPLTNVLSMRLYSFQIPYTWYAIDYSYGNTYFWVSNSTKTTNVLISVTPGNYSPSDFITELALAFTNAGFSGVTALVTSTTPPPAQICYNQNNAKITLNLYGITGPFTIDETSVITFFDYTGQLKALEQNETTPQNYPSEILLTNSQSYINQTLGWIMGYRLPYINVSQTGNVAPAILDLNGPKYLIVSIDDYNQNHINNGLVSITELSKTLKMPNYYSPDLPYQIVTPVSNLQSNINSINTDAALNPNGSIQEDSGDLLMDKLNASFKKIPQLLPSAPRTLTQSQMYTINEIIKNNDNNSNFRTMAPTTTDVFALIPVKSNVTTGSTYVEFSGSLQDNIRTYFGPVNIDRLRVRLLDDKGNVLDLHGGEWSITIISENLYQY
jgi:hypothetical protein